MGTVINKEPRWVGKWNIMTYIFSALLVILWFFLILFLPPFLPWEQDCSLLNSKNACDNARACKSVKRPTMRCTPTACGESIEFVECKTYGWIWGIRKIKSGIFNKIEYWF